MAQFPKRSRNQITLAFLVTLILGTVVTVWFTVQSGTPHMAAVMGILAVFVVIVVASTVWLAKEKPRHAVAETVEH